VGRLYLRIWFAVVVTGVTGLVLGIIATRMLFDVPGQMARAMLDFVSMDQVVAEGDAQSVGKRLNDLEQRHGVAIRALDPSGALIATATQTNGEPSSATDYIAELKLDSGRRLQLIAPPPLAPKAGSMVLSIFLIALGVAAATYPIVRRITRRLERLKTSVELLGAGKFDVRVEVQGNDEVAALAKSFNESAQRITKLVESNRSLLANASHELRSPLARVRMATELLAQKAGAADGAEANEIRLSIRELDALIDEILTGSSLERIGFAEAPSPIDLRMLVHEECLRVEAHLVADPVTVFVHPVLYRRMARNLLENAAKYGMGNPIAVNLRVTNGRVELSVLDQGIGVPPAEAERIFDPFYRRKGASEVSGGVGLGLALAREIARKHGGDIDCRPNQPRGSIFRAWLPYVQPSSRAAQADITKSPSQAEQPLQTATAARQ
jgi:two-component system, OmpR family, sensor kinase